jgi:hypothetical protein
MSVVVIALVGLFPAAKLPTRLLKFFGTPRAIRMGPIGGSSRSPTDRFRGHQRRSRLFGSIDAQRQEQFVADSPLERTGFELAVPVYVRLLTR